MEIPLNASAQATADANGNATVFLYGSPTAGSTWTVKRMTTSVNGNGATPQSVINLVTYTNSVSETNRRDATSSAAQDTSETDIPLQASEFIIGVYTGAPPGSICTLTVTGTIETGR